MRNLALLIATLSSTAALAQKVTLLPFTGDKAASTARTQLVTALCDQVECVPSGPIVTRNRPDPKKLKKSPVDAAVMGTVAVKKKVKTLTLEVFNSAGTSKAKKAFTLDASGLSDKNLAAAVDAVLKVSGGAKKAAPTPEPVKEDKPTPVATREPTPATRAADPAPVSKPNKPSVSDDVRDDVREEAEPEPTPSAKKKSSDPFLIVDLGADLLTRKFEYANLTTPNLRRYDLPFFPAIAARAEFYPLAISGTGGAAAGLGVDLGVGLAPFLKSRKASETEAYPTSMTRFDAGLRFRIVPVKTLGLAITPYAGFRLHSFTVAPNTAGTRLDGLPNISHTGLRAGAQVDLTVLDGALSFTGRFGVIPVFSAGEIISAAYFPSGSDFGLDAGLAVGVRIVGPLSVRAAFEFARYSLSFKTTEADTYIATGASDQYLGGNIGLRLSL